MHKGFTGAQTFLGGAAALGAGALAAAGLAADFLAAGLDLGAILYSEAGVGERKVSAGR